MSSACPQVSSLAAVLSLLQLHQSCRWQVKPGMALQVQCSERGREAMLTLQPAGSFSGQLQHLLRRRAQFPEEYDGCYLCLSAEQVLTCWRRLSALPAEDAQHIARLLSLADVALATAG